MSYVECRIDIDQRVKFRKMDVPRVVQIYLIILIYYYLSFNLLLFLLLLFSLLSSVIG